MDFLSEPGFEPVTSGFKSNALSIRPTTAHFDPYSLFLAIATNTP